MNQTLQLVQELVARGEIRISEHGYDELTADNISVEDVLHGVANADLVEDYPGYFKGPSVLVLQKDTTALSRSFSIREMQRIEVRAEAFNVLNSFRPDGSRIS